MALKWDWAVLRQRKGIFIHTGAGLGHCNNSYARTHTEVTVCEWLYKKGKLYLIIFLLISTFHHPRFIVSLSSEGVCTSGSSPEYFALCVCLNLSVCEELCVLLYPLRSVLSVNLSQPAFTWTLVIVCKRNKAHKCKPWGADKRPTASLCVGPKG